MNWHVGRIAAYSVSLLLLAFASTARGQTVTFYWDINYGGGSFSASSDMSFPPDGWNDQISSISIPSGTTLTVYQDANFGGQSLTLTDSVADLRAFPGPGPDGTWNDQISSFRIAGSSVPGPPFVILVNGSRVISEEWVNSSSPDFQAIAATYGVTPQHFAWTDNTIFPGVLFPEYGGIATGAFRLANFLDSLPPGEIDIVTHSHGGNVANMATWITSRRYRHLINMATPVNWDLWYSRNICPWPYGTDHHCTTSSFIDWVQFIGASPFQVQEFSYATYDAQVLVSAATDSFQQGYYTDGLADAIMAAAYVAEAIGWWQTTKQETDGDTYEWYDGHLHGDMTHSDVWNAVAGSCAVN